MIKSKKLSTLVAASLILAGGSFLGVQTVSADDATRLAAVEALASQNHDSISELKETVKNISTTPEQLQQIDTNKADIATNKGNIAANKTDIAANKTAIDQNKTDIATNKTDIAKEAAARKDADTKLDTRITNVKDYLEKQTAADYVSKTDAAVQDGAVVKADKTIGENVTNLDGALAKETAARIGADKAQDKVIQTVNDNLVKSVNTINKNVADGFNALNATDQKLQGNIDAEAKARTDADTKLDTRITNVKEYLENQTAGNYVSKSDAAVQDGAVVKANKTIGENVTNLDGALAKETAARIGADKAQDKVIQTVNDNLVKSVNTINKNVADGFNALNATDQKLQGNIDAEAKARADKDTAHDTAIKANTDNIAQIKEDLAASNLEDMRKTAANLKNYDTQMSTVQALAAGNKDNIDKNKTAIDQNKSDIATNKADIATNKADIATNKSDIATNKADIATNKADIATNKSDIATNKADIATNKADIATNKADIATNKSDIATNKADIATNKADIATNKADIATNKADIATNKADIATNKADIASNKADIATNKADIATNKAGIATNKADIATNKADIAQEVKNRTKAVADEAAARESGDNALQNQIKKESAARQADISRLDNKIHDVSKEVDTVGALSMAMSGLHPLSYDEGDARFQLSAAVGTYDGTEALALGGFYHFNRDSMLSVGVATDLGADEHRMGANVGYTRRIGQGGHVSRPSEGTVSDIMKDIKNLEQKQAKLEQENEQLKQQLAALKK